MKDLKDKVVVITGATSGIGRATALEFCKEGAKVVLSGRDADALKEADRECSNTGADTLTVTCDVTQEDQVEQLAQRAQEAFGGIDVWVNNAGVAMFAKFEDAPSNDYRQVIETDFFGYVYGARAALHSFKERGSGVLINVDSIEGIAPKPYNSAYTAAKHAVRALASSLRMELAMDGARDIHVSTILPASVDTPLFAHAANYTGRSIQASPVVLTPTQVAEAIVKLAKKPQRELILGVAPKGSAMQYQLAPRSYERSTARNFPARHLSENQSSSGTGNLFSPTEPHATSGGWRQMIAAQKSPKKLRPWMIIGGAIVGAGALATWMMWPKARKADKDRSRQPAQSKQLTTLKKLVPALSKS